MAGFQQSSLVDKLVKLKNTQQSIETVSSWCTFYRKVRDSLDLRHMLRIVWNHQTTTGIIIRP